MHKIIFTLALFSLLMLPACQISPSDAMFESTGEENLLSQARGMIQLAADALRPQPRTASDAAVAHTGLNPFGVNTFLNQEVEPQKRERSVQMIADAGFHWIRQEFPWEDIEIHGKGDFVDRRNDLDGDGQLDAIDAWAKYDHIVDLAEQYNLEVVPRLSNPPAWTRALTNTIGAYAPPDELTDWGDYVYAVVSRYRGRMRYYQLWNEPNIYPEWGERPVSPEEYTRLLCEGYHRAKEADPEAIIVSGALAPTVSLHPGPGPTLGLNDLLFLQRMYDAGAGACFDILAVNDYMLWSGPTDHRLRPLNINFSRPIYIRDIMVANGDAAKPIWISEMNSNAVPNDPNIQGVGAYGQVTLEQQARFAPLAYQRTMEEWPWMGVVNFWFFKLPSDARKNQSMYYFRMVEPDFTTMPVYESMQKYITTLRPTLYPGVHQENHWALEYEGDWERMPDEEATLGAYRRAASPGATLSFAFEGASLTLSPGPEAGEIELRVDEGPARRISLDGRPVQLVKGRRQKRREIRLTVTAGEVGVDMLTVQPPWRPHTALLLGATALVILVAWGLIRRR